MMDTKIRNLLDQVRIVCPTHLLFVRLAMLLFITLVTDNLLFHIKFTYYYAHHLTHTEYELISKSKMLWHIYTELCIIIFLTSTYVNLNGTDNITYLE